MTRLEVRSLRIFFVAFALTAIASMFPMKMLSIPAELGNMLRLPVVPITHLGSIIATTIRPPSAISLGVEEGMSWEERAELFSVEMERFRRLWSAKRKENENLRKKLEILQMLPEGSLQKAAPLLVSTEVTSRTPGNKDAPVEIRIPVAIEGRILKGSPVVIGEDLIGRVERVSTLWATVRPLGSTYLVDFVNESFRTIGSVIHERRIKEDYLQKALLQPIGNGNFETIIPRGAAIGDSVLLDDDRWPESVQGFYIGRVEKGLRKTMTFEYEYDAQESSASGKNYFKIF